MRRPVLFVALLLLSCAGLADMARANQTDVERDPDFLAGRAALEDGFYDAAALKFEEFVNRTPSTRRKAYASIFMLRAWYGQGNYNRIITWLRANWDISRGTRYEAASMYWYARAKYAMDQPADTLRHLREYEIRYPGDEFIPYAIRLRGQALRELDRRDAAAGVFAAFDAAYPDRADVPENLLDWVGVLIDLKQTGEARELLARLVRTYPGREEAHRARLWLGQLDIEQKQHEEAAGWLTPLATDTGAPAGLRADAWIALARSAVDQGAWTNALAALQKGENLTTNLDRKVEARIDQARLLMRSNRQGEAIEIMNQAVAAFSAQPQVSIALLELADLLRAQGRYEQAAEAYQKYVESFSDLPGIRHATYSKAWCLWALRQYAEAALTFEKAFGVLHNQVLREQALVKAGDSYFMNAQYRLAATTYERVLDVFPATSSRSDLLYQAGESYARAGEPADAVRLFRAVADAPGAPEMAATGLARLARIHEEQRDWSKALVVYEEIMTRFPATDHYPRALQARGVLKYRLGRHREALADFNRLLAEFPGTSWAEQAALMRTWTTYQLGDVQRALELGTAFPGQYPGSVWIADMLFWRAEHDYNRQDFGAAETNFAAIAASFPTNRLAAPALYWAGKSAAEQKAHRRAIDDYYNVLIRGYPDSPVLPETRFAQGDALTEIGDYAGAILAFNEIVTQFPENPLVPRALGRIGDCQFTLGSDRPARYHDAVETYRTLLARPQLSRDLAVQTEYKLARAYERLGLVQDAAAHYLNVVYQWLAARQQGIPVDEVWFVRAAFAGAALKEAAEAWEEALRIYERVVESGVTAAPDAAIRIDRILNQRQKATVDGPANGRANR